MEKYQGEDIGFCIEYENDNTEIIANWSKFQEVIAFLYTDGCTILKYSSTKRDGYNELSLISLNSYFGNIKNVDSKILSPGNLMIEVKGIINSEEKYIYKNQTGVFIRRSFIKNS